MLLTSVYLIVLLVYNVNAHKYNVLFIVVDDLRPALGIYNDSNAYTPNIDKLSQNSVVFKNAFCQQALCAPSRNSFLTSRRPDTLHLYDFYNYWRQTVGNITTIPQHFKENGYVTHSVGKVFHPGISSNRTDDYPLSWSDKPFHPVSQKYKNAKVCVDSNGNFGTNIVCPVRVQDQPGATLPDLEVLQDAVKFVNTMKNRTKPYFLAVGFQKPHIPLKYPREYLDMHPIDEVVLPAYREKPVSMPIVAWNPWNDIRLRDDIKGLNISFPFGKLPTNYTRKIVQNYAAAVTYIDDLIGRLLWNINLENTIVVLLGDHGVSMGEHGEFSKYSNFDIATRVPFIIRVPHFTNQPLIFDRIVELLDIFPTLVDLTMLSSKMKTCTRSMVPVTKLCTEGKSLLLDMIKLKYSNNTQNTKEHDLIEDQYFAISQHPRPSDYPTVNPDSDKPKQKQIKIMGYSIRTQVFRYTEWIGFNGSNFCANWTQVYAKELYNHNIDPYENMNMAELAPFNNIMSILHDKLLSVLNI